MRSSEEDDHERQYHRKQPTTISFAKFYERTDLETISPERSSADPRRFKRAAYCRGSPGAFFCPRLSQRHHGRLGHGAEHEQKNALRRVPEQNGAFAGGATR